MGYEVGHYPVKLNQHTSDLAIVVRKYKLKTVPSAVYSNIGFYLDGRPAFSMFKPSTSSAENMIVSVLHRFGRDMPGLANADFVNYVYMFSAKWFHPLTAKERLWESDWLQKCNYSGSRKRMLYEIKRNPNWSEFFKNKSFLKDEGYVEPKHARSINSYSDLSKSVLGPIIKSIEKKIFSLRWFVKGMDVATRPALLQSLFGASPVAGTDFSSFEAHHRGGFAKILARIHMKMLKAVTTNVERKILWQMMMGRNVCEFKCITASIDQTLMSGALWTSLNNSILNLLICSYLCLRSNNPNDTVPELIAKTEHFKGVFEGDDGLFEKFEPTPGLIASLGIELKLDFYPNFGDASFCGVVCDDQELSVLTDPKKFLRNFFLLPVQLLNARETLKRAFLKCKALSAYHQYKNCPVVGPVSHSILLKTRHITINENTMALLGSWDRDEFEHVKPREWLLPPTITSRSRAKIEKMFGLSPAEQLELEDFDGIRKNLVMAPMWLSPQSERHTQDFCVRSVEYKYWISPPKYYRHALVDTIMKNGLKSAKKLATGRIRRCPLADIQPPWEYVP